MNTRKPFSFRVKADDFKTSSWTGAVTARCVQVARTDEGVAVRDSKDTGKKKRTLFYTHDEWDAFIKGCKGGEFDPPSA